MAQYVARYMVQYMAVCVAQHTAQCMPVTTLICYICWHVYGLHILILQCQGTTKCHKKRNKQKMEIDSPVNHVVWNNSTTQT